MEIYEVCISGIDDIASRILMQAHSRRALNRDNHRCRSGYL